jgi:prepilin-type N-terminal cleavage/methylation domain-containing protein
MQQITLSSPPRPLYVRSAFSLIELIIVILIASLFAALVFSTISIRKPNEERVGIYQLKEAATQTGPVNAQLVCVSKCKECYALHEGKTTPVGSQLPPLQAYILDDNDNPQKIDFGRIKDQPVCLRFHYYSNGSNSQMILETNDGFYFVPSYFGDVKKFDALDGAVEFWLRHRAQLDTVGGYY